MINLSGNDVLLFVPIKLSHTFESELRAWIEDRGPRMPTPEGACWSEATAEVLALALTVTPPSPLTVTPALNPAPNP